MPSGTRDIKRKIKSVNSTMQITKAFELVSTAKLRRARLRLDSSKTYFTTLKTSIDDILNLDPDRRNPFLKPSKFEKPLIILITSDRGLCGGFNINAIKMAINTENGRKSKFIAVGKKGGDFLLSRGREVHSEFHYISENPTYENARMIAKEAVNLYKTGEIDSVYVVFSKFVSTISFDPTPMQLLPIGCDDRGSLNDNLEQKIATDNSKALPEVVTYEPSKDSVLSFLVPKYIEGLIYSAMVESAASEQAARRIAMESASDNAQEIIEELTLTFNQARQAAITQEISEIVGGAEALE